MAAANLPPSRQRGERFGGAGAARRRPGFRGAAGGSSPGSGQVGAGRKTRVCCWYRSRAWRLQSSYDPVTAQFSKQSGKLSSTMASRLVRKVNSKEGEPPCKERRAILLSPVGKIEISGCEKGLHEIKLPKTSVLPSRAESSAACEVCEGAEEMTEPLTQCAAWLRAYFCQPARMTSLPVPAFHHPLLQRESFTSQVLWTLLRDVKFGEAVSYKQLAALAGNSRAARAVGGAMRSNPMAIVIPCHRVICSSGQTGNYGAGSPMKEWLLSHEKLQKEKSA
ncbi:methylated-DNA--protein-cysteine methyltransferase isoform X2 [Opisthocomus hoazin]|uniref:methylated-DNA--protein-cysteine methyltransferase isoform X2 n=1 Tax=Opisthocomus hoazin TaxID=30419 RepID=UPI003F52F9AB